MEKRRSIIAKNKIGTKQDLLKFFRYLLIFLLLCLAVNYLARCFAVGYVVPQDKFAFRGILLIGFSFILLQGFNFKNFRTWIPIVIVLIPVARFFLTKEMLTIYRVYERDIWGMWNAEKACYVAYTAILADGIFERKFKKFSLKSHIPIILPVIALVLTGLFTQWHKDYLAIVCAALIIGLMDIDKEKLKIYSLCLGAAIALVIGMHLMVSFIKVPSAGEEFYSGIYLNSITFAMVLGVGLCACLLFVAYWLSGNEKARIVGIVSLFIGLFLVYGVYVSMARTAFLGILLAVMAALWVILKSRGKSRFFWICLLGLMIVGVVMIWVSVTWYNRLRDGLAVYNGSNNNVIIRTISKLWAMIYLYSDMPTVYLQFPEGGFLHRLNVLTSGRAELWVLSIQRFHFLKGNTEPITWFDGLQSNAHNTYIAYMYSFGVLPGILIIGSWIWSLVCIIRDFCVSVKRKMNPDPLIILAILCSIYSLTVFINEVNYFNTITAFLQLFFPALAFQTGKTKIGKQFSKENHND